MKYTPETPESPATLSFGKILSIDVYHHAIDFNWFNQHLCFSFAWWASGENFAILDMSIFEYMDDLGINLLTVKIAKVCYSIIID